MRIILVSILLIALGSVYSQTESKQLYNPEVDAKAEIKAAVKKAGDQNKHILIQVGGNW